MQAQYSDLPTVMLVSFAEEYAANLRRRMESFKPTTAAEDAVPEHLRPITYAQALHDVAAELQRRGY